VVEPELAWVNNREAEALEDGAEVLG